MGRLDNKLRYSTAQAITTTAASNVASETVLDIGQLSDLGNGIPLAIEVLVTKTFTGAGGINAVHQSSELEDFSDSSKIIEQDLGKLGAAAKIGDKLIGNLDPFKVTNRYNRIQYKADGAVAAGTIDSGIILVPGTDTVGKYYDDDVTIN